MKAHYTGFEPWGDISYNPSWDVALGAAEVSGTSAELLPVSFDVIDLVFEGFVVHFGVAAKREFVELERYAHNIKVGNQGSAKIFENGKTAYETKLDLSHHLDALNENASSEWKFRESRDAGTFVCNSLYYSSLGQNLNRLFIHVPMMDAAAARALGRKIGLHFDSVSI